MLRAAGPVLDGAALGASPVRRILAAAAVLLVLSCLAAPAAASDRIEVRSAELRLATEGDTLLLDASFDFDLPWALEDAVSRGVPLYFVIDFELYRSRWYWFDERRAAAALTYRLSYSPLTREYRLARGTLALPYQTLGEALASLRRVTGWAVAERAALVAGAGHAAQVRMRLDPTQLPRPFQIGAITSRDWTLESEWRNVPVRPDLLR
ncbi:MAG: DUF4390 domain-containing protein [Burkholderiaceae bacterium]|jgi:hypothetical protein|nr:DUF4390 domain-containing protein [Burkholderiaceae bacterium]